MTTGSAIRSQLPTGWSVRTRWSALASAFRPGPAARYVHPKARALLQAEGEHDAALDVAEDSAPNYLRWIADRIRPHLGGRVLEVGAGTGSITAQFAAGREVVVTDLSEWCIDELRRRFDAAPNVTVRHVDAVTLVDEGQRFDSIVMLNVLEHIADDVAVLQTLGKLLEPEGRIILYVPALNGLYGPWDRKVGHYRRYAPWRLRAVLAAAGLVDVDVRYMNLLSVPAWWAFSRTKAERGVGRSLALWDRTGIRLGRRFESVVRVPVGLNVFCVARLDR